MCIRDSVTSDPRRSVYLVTHFALYHYFGRRFTDALRDGDERLDLLGFSRHFERHIYGVCHRIVSKILG